MNFCKHHHCVTTTVTKIQTISITPESSLVPLGHQSPSLLPAPDSHQSPPTFDFEKFQTYIKVHKPHHEAPWRPFTQISRLSTPGPMCTLSRSVSA